MDSDTARGSVTDSSDHTSSSRFLDHFWCLNARGITGSGMFWLFLVLRFNMSDECGRYVLCVRRNTVHVRPQARQARRPCLQVCLG